jgi:hypothetical protein
MHFEEAVSSFYQSCTPSPMPRTRLHTHQPTSVPCPSLPLPPGGSPEGELYSDTMDNIADTVPLCIRLHASQITEAKKSIMTALESRAELALTGDFHLSAQDVMTALTIAAINRADPGHVAQVLTTVNVSAICSNPNEYFLRHLPRPAIYGFVLIPSSIPSRTAAILSSPRSPESYHPSSKRTLHPSRSPSAKVCSICEIMMARSCALE